MKKKSIAMQVKELKERFKVISGPLLVEMADQNVHLATIHKQPAQIGLRERIILAKAVFL